MIRNVHERTLVATPEEVGALIDSLASPGDRLWPAARWPAMRLDAPLAHAPRLAALLPVAPRRGR
jgi:hypothetical protein